MGSKVATGFMGPAGSPCGKHILCSTKGIICEKRRKWEFLRQAVSECHYTMWCHSCFIIGGSKLYNLAWRDAIKIFK
jgi:hypothetical protein